MWTRWFSFLVIVAAPISSGSTPVQETKQSIGTRSSVLAGGKGFHGNQLLRSPEMDVDKNGRKTAYAADQCYDESTVRSCGSIISANNTLLRSPIANNLTWEYPNNLDCEWEVRAPAEHRIKFEFLCFFKIQATADCSSDYLKITEDTSAGASYCGTRQVETMDPYVTKETNATVTFHTDLTVNGEGFAILVSFVPFSEITPSATTAQSSTTGTSQCFDVATTTSCGGNITTNWTMIRSPVEDEISRRYPSNLECSWNIVAPEDCLVTIKFICPLSMEPVSELGTCTDDYVEIVEPGKNDVRHCGTGKPGNFKSAGNHVIVTFRSDSDTITAQGFVIQVVFSSAEARRLSLAMFLLSCIILLANRYLLNI